MATTTMMTLMMTDELGQEAEQEAIKMGRSLQLEQIYDLSIGDWLSLAHFSAICTTSSLLLLLLFNKYKSHKNCDRKGFSCWLLACFEDCLFVGRRNKLFCAPPSNHYIKL